MCVFGFLLASAFLLSFFLISAAELPFSVVIAFSSALVVEDVDLLPLLLLVSLLSSIGDLYS